MNINKEIFEFLDIVRSTAVTILMGDGHKINDFYVKDTNKFSNSFIEALSIDKDNVDLNKLRDLIKKENEGIYLIMKKYNKLSVAIDSLSSFNMRYCHYLNSLDKFLD